MYKDRLCELTEKIKQAKYALDDITSKDMHYLVPGLVRYLSELKKEFEIISNFQGGEK